MTDTTPLQHYPRGDGGLTEVQLEICARIMEGASVRTITLAEDMPSQRTVMYWLADNPAFRTAYLLAKQLQAEVLFEEALAISDDAEGDWVDTDDGKVFDKEHVQRAKLRVDTRKWAVGKLAPRRYGDASTLRLEDAEGREGREYSVSEIAARLAAIANATLAKKGQGA